MSGEETNRSAEGSQVTDIHTLPSRAGNKTSSLRSVLCIVNLLSRRVVWEKRRNSTVEKLDKQAADKGQCR